MTLRVDSLSPRVLLSVAPPPEERITAEHLRVFRSNPGALTQSLAELAEIVGGMRGADFSRLAGRDNLAVLLDALSSAMLGREQIERGFSLRDAVRSLGLHLEGDLRKALESPGSNPVPSQAGLKASLMKVLEEFQAKLQSAEINTADAKAIRELTPALERPFGPLRASRFSTFTSSRPRGSFSSRFPSSCPASWGKRIFSSAMKNGAPVRGSKKRLSGWSLPSRWMPWAT